MPEKEFFIYLENAVIFVWRHTEQGEFTDFRVVLLAEINGKLCCISRYDTAHGFAHQDILGKRKGSLAKKPFLDSNKAKAFHYAIEDFKAHFKAYISFFKKN